MAQLLFGAIGMASLTVGLLFARFWRKTHDRFFLFFAASFWVEGINRLLMGAFPIASEEQPVFYLIRLSSFMLILVAIAQKNRPR